MRRVAALAALCIVVGLLLYLRPARVFPRGSAIVHDDFRYTVTDVSVRSDARRAVYGITILVENRAVRVPYVWRDDIAYTVDGNGRAFRPVSHQAVQLAPGTAAQVVVRFVVPVDARRIALRFWDGILMGDVLDGVQYARAAVPLY
jgi:hypothetical protein